MHRDNYENKAAGPGKWDKSGEGMSMPIKKREQILSGKYAGNEIEINGVKHLIINEDDILGIIEKD